MIHAALETAAFLFFAWIGFIALCGAVWMIATFYELRGH